MERSIGKYYSIYRVLMLMTFLNSISPWWRINNRSSEILIAIFAIMICFKKGELYTYSRSKRYISICFFLLFSYEAMRSTDILYAMRNACIFIVTWSLIHLKDNYKRDIIDLITKWFAIIVFISLCGHIAYLMGVNMPHKPLVLKENVDTFGYGHLWNYYFFVTMPGWVRFQGPFLEPGYMAALGITPILYINRYNLKNKYVFILFIGNLFSFSLAGYVSSFIGFFFQSICNRINLNKLITLSGVALVFVIFSFVAKQLINDSVFEELIERRLEYDEERETIEGDNRANKTIKKEFEKVISSSDIWFGASYEVKVNVSSPSVQTYVIHYGVLGIFLVFIAYISPIVGLNYKRDRESAFLILLTFSILLPDCYPTSRCLLISLLCGVEYMQRSRYYVSYC